MAISPGQSGEVAIKLYIFFKLFLLKYFIQMKYTCKKICSTTTCGSRMPFDLMNAMEEVQKRYQLIWLLLCNRGFQWYLRKWKLRQREYPSGNCRGNNYRTTLILDDRIQDNICMLHENCDEFKDICSNCGNKKMKELKDVKDKVKSKK